MKTNRADIEFYREMMEHFQAESASKSAQLRSLQEEVTALRKENMAMRESHREDIDALRRSHEESMDRLRESHRKAMADMQASFEKRLDRMAEANAGLSQQLGDALSSGRLARSKKYGRSSEQRNLPNNRKGSNRSEEEDNSDGTPPDDGTHTTAEDQKPEQTKGKEKGKGRRGNLRGKRTSTRSWSTPWRRTCTFPRAPGCFRAPCGGSVEYIPGRTVCHRYPYRRYILEQPDEADKEAVFGDTLPKEIRDMCPVDGCMLSASMVAFIMTQRYAYHLPQKRIRLMLRDMGAHIPRATLNRFFMAGAEKLHTMLGEAFRTEIRRGGYFMVDETLQTVGVEDKELGRRYMNRYLWEFYNRDKGLVEYVYEDGSRAQKVLRSFFDADPASLEMVLSCDGYNAYKLFDSGEYPHVTLVGCWTHARRNFVDALPFCRPQCEEIIDMMAVLFENEAVCAETGTVGEARLAYRKKRSGPVLDTIRAAVERMWNDTGLMAVGLLKKAVGYVRNQWKYLSNILESGVAEISNNLSEQRVKPIKLSLKNCQNIGSEEAAKRHAFMHSLAESCRLNAVNVADYFGTVFSRMKSKPRGDELNALLPNMYPMKC